MPVGRSALPVGRSALPVGRSAMPVGCSALPVGRGAMPVGCSALPVGRGAMPVGRSALPVGRGALPVGRMPCPWDRSALPVGRSAMPVGLSAMPVAPRVNSVRVSPDSLLLSLSPPFTPEPTDLLQYHVSYWENTTSATVKFLSDPGVEQLYSPAEEEPQALVVGEGSGLEGEEPSPNTCRDRGATEGPPQ
ncbi:hypothetical protein DUI87_31183 [Hirundo rustica rustica]|uniref:Uncharacterized protein n=1 Tax=Hirundo rustica rustica TaxID=333673 RepID=A0A3M0J083_HIRRU|nr:hypothetical protein DUI87_31183 [Hirundo rustica rustica]